MILGDFLSDFQYLYILRRTDKIESNPLLTFEIVSKSHSDVFHDLVSNALENASQKIKFNEKLNQIVSVCSHRLCLCFDCD